MKPFNSVLIKFQYVEDYIAFCRALQASGIPYSLGGSRTVVVRRIDRLEDLKGEAKKELRGFLAKGYKVRRLYHVMREIRRKLPTAEETQEKLKKYSREK
jgi:hypothetical protein